MFFLLILFYSDYIFYLISLFLSKSKINDNINRLEHGLCF